MALQSNGFLALSWVFDLTRWPASPLELRRRTGGKAFAVSRFDDQARLAAARSTGQRPLLLIEHDTQHLPWDRPGGGNRFWRHAAGTPQNRARP